MCGCSNSKDQIERIIACMGEYKNNVHTDRDNPIVLAKYFHLTVDEAVDLFLAHDELNELVK